MTPSSPYATMEAGMSKYNFTVIRESGRSEYYPDTEYFSVISNIAHEYMTAGRNWDRPNILLMNGRIVVPEGIAGVAWEYHRRNRQLHDELRETLRKEFAPDWLEANHDN